MNATLLEVQAENGWFVKADVEYTDRKTNQKRRVTISGGRVNWILRKL
ncbi:hypothetical protein [Scytonema sp. HK-05]|nr:hypothetical protein [Scytonema sp. HK-05]